MSSENTMTTAAATGGDLFAVMTCPTCGATVVHAEALRCPTFRAKVDGLHLEFVHLSHTDRPAADGGREAAIEGDLCNHERGRAPWTVPAGTPTFRIGKRAAYRDAHARMQAQRRALRAALRRSVG